MGDGGRGEGEGTWERDLHLKKEKKISL